MRNPFSRWDALLFVIYGYLILDVIFSWKKYENCYAPIQIFLLATYCSIIIHKSTVSLQNATDISSLGKKLVNCFFYWIIMPGFIFITILGIVWQIQNSNKTPKCVPQQRIPIIVWWWIILLIVFDILLILMTIAKIIDKWRIFVFRRRIRRLVNAMDEIDDRLLNQLLLSITHEDGNLNDKVGLTVADIEKIPQKTYSKSFRDILQFNQNSCSICFEEYLIGKNITILPGCEHNFHPHCINAWLLKNPLCPICRSNIRNSLYINIVRSYHEPIDNLV